MARPVKPGLQYFPFDIDFFQDIRIRKLIKRQGGKAITVYTLLLCLIYKNGYYMQWDTELPFICSESTGFDEAFISEVIKACLAVGLFDKNIYAAHQVLTSRSIQTRYCKLQRLTRRNNRLDKFSLLDTPETDDDIDDPTPPACTDVPPARAQGDTGDNSPSTPLSAPVSGDNMRWLTEFFSDNHHESLLLLCKSFGLPYGDIETLRTLAIDVVTEWEISRTSHPGYSDWSRHLIASMRIKNRELSASSKTASSSTRSQQPAPTPPADYSFKGGFGGQDI